MEAKELTPAADVFAVAVLLMELWSGKAPFRRRTREDIEAAMRAPHPRPSDADARLIPLDDVIASALSLDPAARPQQADDLGRALRRFLAGIDLGDLARHLGDRVRELRLHPAPPPTEPRPMLQRPPSRPTATQVGTKTFAARDDVGAIRQPSSSADPVPEISTRRMESMPPDATPRAPEIVAIEPPATASPRVPPRRGITLVAAAGAAAIAIAAFFVGRAASDTVTPAGAAPASSAPVPVASSPDLPPVVPPAPPAPAVPATATAAAAERAQLVLLGDGTLVSVDGVPRGACPAHVTVEPGTHAVVFSFPPTGESRGESLTLRGGEHATLHADFTGAAPSIRAQPR
jgi:serine/threonine-protein kinase